MSHISIEQITHELTWRLRQQVLYPDKAIRDMAMNEDEDGIHYGAFVENKLVAVVSIFRQGNGMQIRKFTVDLSLQRQGIGSALLQYITDRARESGVTRLWCNARITATDFYLKASFKPNGDVFTRNNIDYRMMSKSFIKTDKVLSNLM